MSKKGNMPCRTSVIKSGNGAGKSWVIYISHRDDDHGGMDADLNVWKVNLDGEADSHMRAIICVPHHGGETEQNNLAGSAPPRPAEFVAALFVKPELREHVLGCWAEDFANNVVRFGRSRAVALYWWDIIVSICPLFWAIVKRGLGLATLADIYRRITGSL